MSNKMMLCGALILLGSLSGCAAFMNQLSNDPVADWEVEAVRAPQEAQSYAFTCKQREDVCERYGDGTVDYLQSCFEQTHNCYMSIPGATRVSEKFHGKKSAAIENACSKNLPGGGKAFCFARHGEMATFSDPI